MLGVGHVRESKAPEDLDGEPKRGRLVESIEPVNKWNQEASEQTKGTKGFCVQQS